MSIWNPCLNNYMIRCKLRNFIYTYQWSQSIISGKCGLQRDSEILSLWFHGSMIVGFGKFKLRSRYILIPCLSLCDISKISASPKQVKLLIVLTVFHRIPSNRRRQHDPCYFSPSLFKIHLFSPNLTSLPSLFFSLCFSFSELPLVLIAGWTAYQQTADRRQSVPWFWRAKRANGPCDRQEEWHLYRVLSQHKVPIARRAAGLFPVTLAEAFPALQPPRCVCWPVARVIGLGMFSK